MATGKSNKLLPLVSLLCTCLIYLQQMIEFPDPNLADEEGLIAYGGELSPDYLLSAYSQGIYPWFCEGEPILWWSPNPRMVLIPKDFKLKKSLRQVINKGIFELRVDTAFREVIKSCSKVKRSHEDETWITKDIIEGYVKLNKLGYAHSFESFYKDKLVGGLYGVSLGNCFFGESMFFTKTDASKVAFYHLVQFALKHKFSFIDAQQPTDHLSSLGAIPIPRKDFLKMLESALQKDTLQGKWTDLV
jgi:leucyl/phenylalanyl-tRNA--protein transferase